MTDPGPRLERFLERAAGFASGSSLHPATLLHEVSEAASASVRGGTIANAYTIELAKADAEFFGRNREQLIREIETSLNELARSQNLRRTAPWEIEFASTANHAGQVKVVASFRNVAPAGKPVPAGETRAIRRHSGKFLVVDQVGRIALSHTPFTIGRGPDCDLSLADLSVSRRHAVVETTDSGELVIRDLQSRNRLTVDGEAHDEIVLAPNVHIALGSSIIWLEQSE